MKKIITIAALVLTTQTLNIQTTSAQSADEQERIEAAKKARQSKDAKKLEKEAKKQAKKRTKEGWDTPAGNLPIERQFFNSYLNADELMVGDDGVTVVPRYIQLQNMTTANTYNAAFAAAAQKAREQISASLTTNVAMAMSSAIDNSQSRADQAVTVDEIHARAKAITENCLKNSTPVVTLYRRLPNGNFEVDVTIAYDKKQLQQQILQQIRDDLRKRGDQLLPSVNVNMNIE